MRRALEHWTKLSRFYDKTLSASVQSIACATIKELGKKPKTFHAWDYKQTHKNDDKKLCQALLKELSEADVIVTHNGLKFDMPFLQTRLALNNLNPLGSITHVDTLRIARNKYKFISNRLGDLAKFLKIKYQKHEHDGWKLWEELWAGKSSARKEMSHYNKYDVLVLEEIFKVFRPLIKTLPIAKHGNCPCCHHAHVIKWGVYFRKSKAYIRYRCVACGGFSLKANENAPLLPL